MPKTSPVNTAPISDLRSPSPDAVARSSNDRRTRQDSSLSSHIDACTEKPRPTERPTSFGSEITRIANTEGGARLIAKVVREVLKCGRFSSAGDLRDAVEIRCTDLGLSFTRGQVERAMDLVGSNTQLLTAHRVRPAARPVSPATEPAAIKHSDAKAILAQHGIDVNGGRFRASGTTPPRPRLEPL